MNKADGNFMNIFYFQRLGDSDIFMGSYPQNEADIQRLHNAGITAVINIMDQIDIEQRSFDYHKFDQIYKNKGIDVVINSPVTDEKDEAYTDQLFQAAQHLYDLSNV